MQCILFGVAQIMWEWYMDQKLTWIVLNIHMYMCVHLCVCLCVHIHRRSDIDTGIFLGCSLPYLFKDFNNMHMCVCLSGVLCSWVQCLGGPRRRYLIPWNWSYWHLWTTWYRCLELSLGDQQVKCRLDCWATFPALYIYYLLSLEILGGSEEAWLIVATVWNVYHTYWNLSKHFCVRAKFIDKIS